MTMHLCIALVEEYFVLGQMRSNIFSTNCRWNGPISWRHIRHWLLFPLKDNRCGPYRLHPEELLLKLCWLTDPAWPILAAIFVERPTISNAVWFLVSWGKWILRPPCRNSSVLGLNNTKRSFGVVRRLSLWYLKNKDGTRLVDNFLKPKWTFKFETTLPYDNPSASRISSTFNLPWANTLSWISSIISGVEKSIGQSEWSILHLREHNETQQTTSLPLK